MSNLYAQVLHEILVQHGRGVCDDPRRLKALLRDYLGQHPGNHEQPINVLVLALENRTVSELLGSEGLPLEIVKSRLATRLHTGLGLDEKVASWAVSTWAVVLAPSAAVITPVPAPPRTESPPLLDSIPLVAAAADSVPVSGQLTSLTQPVHGGGPFPMPGRSRRTPLIAAVAGMLLLFGVAGGVGIAWLLNRGTGPANRTADKEVADKTLKPPPPTRWLVVFRSSDPAMWDRDISEGENRFGRSLTCVPDDIRYLRMRKDDDFVIIPMTRDKLKQQSDDGFCGWNGTSENAWRARHLGIYNPRVDLFFGHGSITIDHRRYYSGWGFGCKRGIGDTQGYCWDGKPIGPAAFEIAVTAAALNEAEQRKLLGFRKD